MGEYDLGKEAEETTRELQGEIDELGSLSEQKISELLPKRTDQKRLKELIRAVNQAATENEKKAVLAERAGDLLVLFKEVALKAIKSI